MSRLLMASLNIRTNQEHKWELIMTEEQLPKWRQKIAEAQQQRGVKPLCINCGQPENIILVHGHGQCAYCKVNVMPCCSGETCD